MPGKRLDIENGEVVDSDDTSDDDIHSPDPEDVFEENTDPEELPDNRCPVCTWTGTGAEVTDDQRCPRCGYGVVAFDVRWADTEEEEEEAGTDDDVGGLYEYRYGREGSE